MENNDPHHPPPFTSFSPFPNSHPFPPPQLPFYGGSINPSPYPPPNNNFFQVPPPQQPAPITHNPSLTHPPYSDMICSAIAALNEPDGSSKQAISRYIERTYTAMPQAHNALLTHHLKTLKNSGVLMMVRKSYKFAVAPSQPTSVAVAQAAERLEPPRSDFISNIVVNDVPDLAVSSVPQIQKRGRGRPPKPKQDVQAQPSVIQPNGKPTWEQSQLPVPQPQTQIQPQVMSQPPVKRPPGRPRKDGAMPTVKAKAVTVPGSVETVKRRGRPPSGRAAGRERKPAVVSAPASVYPIVANGGVKRRGRPRRVDAAVTSVAQPPPAQLANAVSGGEGVVVAKRGRGRPPRIGGVIRKPMKVNRGVPRTGKPRGRPRKNAASGGASQQQDNSYGELHKKFESFKEQAKEIIFVLKAELGEIGNQMVVQAIQKLEELTVTTTDEPQHIEEMQQDEQRPETEGHGQQGQVLTDAEAMQEALF